METTFDPYGVEARRIGAALKDDASQRAGKIKNSGGEEIKNLIADVEDSSRASPT